MPTLVRGRDVRRRARRPALEQLPARLPGRRRPRAAVALRDARGALRSTAVAPEWRGRCRARVGDRSRAFASASRPRSFRDGTCGRYFRSWITDLDRDALRGLRLSPAPRRRRASAASSSAHVDRVADISGPALAPSPIAPRDPRRRARRARLSGARDERDDVRARGAPARARAVRGVGTSGDDRACRRSTRIFTCAAMEPADAARALQRSARRAAGHRHAIPSAGRAGRRDRASASGCPRTCRSCCVRSRCSRSIPTTTRCSRACWPPCPTARLVALRRSASRAHGEASCAPRRARSRARGHRDAASACILLPQCASRRLPAHQSRLRCDARHAALVRRQHEPRRARLRPADGHAAGPLHARPAERGDARRSPDSTS